MSSVQTLTRRIEALEARLADVEGGYGRTLYELRRDTVGIKLLLSKVGEHLGLSAPTEDEIDAVIEEG